MGNVQRADLLCLTIIYHPRKSVFLPSQCGEGFYHPERETGASPVQYPLL
jgi:hypothetical protein